MPNANYSLGTGLMGDPSSTSSGLIVPKPGNPNEYYVFTVDEPHHQNSFAFPNQGPADEFGISTEFYTNPFGSVPEDDDGFNNGLAYSLVDLTLNNGNGDVVTSEKNIQLLTYNPNEQEEESYKCAEKITAVEHSDKQSYWVITHFIDNFYAFRVDSNGVETTPVITNINPLISTSGYRRNGIGYIKASPDGSKIAICHSQNGNQAGGDSDNGSTWIYDFDNSSGILSNPLNLVSNVSQYGVEFSPDSSKLYTSGGGTVLQFDLDAVNPELSFFELAFGFSFFGALQLGPDGKIYVANNEDPFSLDVINFPNELGVDAGYNAYQMNLSSGSSGLGLPPFIQSFFLASIQFENSCVDINTEFSVNSTQAYDSILWDFGDGTDTSTENAPSHTYTSAGTYTVSAEITAGTEVSTFSETIIISSNPIANLADDIDICDDDNDGVMSFDFVAPQTQVLAEQDPTEFTVSYHLSQDDADTNSGALSLPYQNTNSSEEIFVRIENNANTACYDTTSFIINIFNTPVIPQGIQYNLCDYTNPGDLTEVFDLLSLNAEIINGQDVTISHHLSFEDAENGVGAITDPYTNTSPNQVIFVLLENNAYTGCRSIGTYNIIVDPLPDLITNVPLVQCDIDDIQDGISIYNLEEAAENIIIGDDANNYTLSFHLSQEDLDANIGAIADPTNFVNTSPLQTIFTRVENIATTCYSTSFFYLETIFNPIPGDAGLIVCDNSEMNGNDYDGLGLFTLSDANEYILSLIVANPNNDITDADQLDVAYYSSETDALLELGQLPDQYISEVADSQTVFVRIERGNDCFGINTMLLEVIPVPELNEIPDEILCSDNPGIAEVFLTDYDAIVLGSQSANDVIISYHATQQDADLGIGALASPYTVTNQQTIFVREEVQNNDPNQTGCYITNVNFTLTVEPNPSVNIPTPQVLCDDDFDGLQTFDLNGVDIEIIGGQTDMVVSYYTNQNDADSASNPVGDVFQTTQEDTQTLIFRIENITTGCYSTGNLELIVNPLPVLQPLDNFATCDDNVETDNDTSNDSVEFDLLSQNTAVLNGQDPTIFEVSYHLSQIDADQGSNALVSPYTNTSNPQTIFTRVRNTLTDCFNTVPLVLQVNPLPVVNLDEDYLLCVNTNGTEILDPLVIYSNLSATDFSFIWSNANGDVLGTDPDFEPTQGGVYNLEVFDALLPTQCAAPVETFIVIESSPPDVTAEVTSEPFASTHVIQSTGTGQGIYEFSLDQGPWGDSGLFVGVKPGEHIVSVRDLNGCGTVSVPLLVIDYPKFFTPNQDGYNDTWNITALENQPNSKIYIFDRYGKFIKQISTSGIGWDGTYNGAQMPSTDYWFKLEYTDLDTGNLKIFKAHFSLKR